MEIIKEKQQLTFHQPNGENELKIKDEIKEEEIKEIKEITEIKEEVKRSKIKPILRIPFSEFKLKDFEEIVVKKRKPVVLTNSTEGYSPSLWNPQYLLDHYKEIPIDVRYMGYDKNDIYGPFVVLKDSRKRVGWYIKNAEFPDYKNDIDYESSWGDHQNTSAKVVMYAKDFCFGDQIKEWADDIKHLLPESSSSPPLIIIIIIIIIIFIIIIMK